MTFSFCLLARHGTPCPYCGNTMRVGRKRGRERANRPDFPTRDHVIPKSRASGMGTLIVCRGCNLDKAARTLPEWHAILAGAGDPRAVIVKKLMDDNRHLRASADFA